MKYDVIGMGLVVVDHIFLDNKKKNIKNNPLYLGSSGGGSVGNTLSFLGALGFKTSVIGAVGNDIQSEIIKQDFKNFGVHSKWLVQKGGLKDLKRSRQYFHIISEPKLSHKFLSKCPSCDTTIGKNVILTKTDVHKNRKIIEGVKKCRILHLDRANDGSISLARQTLHSGGMVSFDFSFDSYENTRSKSQELISISNIVKVNSNTFRAFLKRNNLDFDEFILRYPDIRLLIETGGDKGIEGFIRGSTGDIKKFKYPAPKCSRLTDASGAGDILIGSILAQILNKTVKLEPEYEKEMLAIAQGLASLNCCFFGARSYSRILAMKNVSISDVFSLGLDTARSGTTSCTLPPDFGIPERFQFPYRFQDYGICSICGASKSKRTRKSKTNGFNERLAEAESPMVQSYKIARNLSMKLGDRSHDLDIKVKPIMFVGSGSSYSAGIFGEQIVMSLLGNPAMTIAPFELRSIATPLRNVFPFLISYGGNNSDILYAFDRLKALNVKEGAIITGNLDSKLALRAEDQGWNIYQVSKKHQGFVASTGYLTTLCALSAILAPNDLESFFDIKNLISIFKIANLKAEAQCAQLGKSNPSSFHFIGLGSGWARGGLYDLESKFVEGGISTIEIADLKNFTHGRYISAYKYRSNRIAIIMECHPYEELVNHIKKKLQKQIKIIELSTDLPSLQGGIDLAVQALYLANHLGIREGIPDITRPVYPKEARGLYSWEPKDPFRSEEVISQKK